MHKQFIVASYLLFLLGYSIYSYTQVDPNLVLSSQSILWQLQQSLWEIGFEMRALSSLIYLILISGAFITYGLLIKAVAAKQIKLSQVFLVFIGAIGLLFLAYPALSHDVFNYMFNAKMVWFYQADPHVQVALDFPQDQWLSFMHNVHTPAPYARGFTLISLLPSFLGQNHLKITLWLFKLFMIGWLALLITAQRKLDADKRPVAFTAFLLNPLLLIETVGNVHNDVVMMGLAMWSVVLVFKAIKNKHWYWWLGAILLFGLSVSIKYATLMMVVGAGIYLLGKRLKKKVSWGDSQSIAMFLPLLTARSKRFLPWYLIWSLSFLPFTRERLINELVILFSFSAMLSYLPYLFTGEYTPEVIQLRTVIIFIPPLAYGLTRFGLDYFQNKGKK